MLLCGRVSDCDGDSGEVAGLIRRRAEQSAAVAVKRKSARSGSFCLPRRWGDVFIFSSFLSVCGDVLRNFTKLQFSLLKAKLKTPHRVILKGKRIRLHRFCEIQKNPGPLESSCAFLVLWKQSYDIWLRNLTKQQLENWIARIEAAVGILVSRSWKRRKKVFLRLQGQLGKISLDTLRTVTWDVSPIS